MNRTVLCLFVFALSAGILSAQDPRGTILGRVTDVSDSVVPGVQVRVTNSATGVTASARTNQGGSYNIPFLPPGTYNVTAELAGFKKYSRDGIHLRVSDNVELNLVLEVGQVTENIEVSAETPLLDTASSTLGQVVDERRILDLPVSGGNPVELAFLTPGVITNRSMIPMKAAFNGTAISAEGSPAFTNEFQIDGISNTFADGTGRARDAFRPPANAIREFRIQSTPYDASVGHTIGAVISVSSASGTNQFHGEAHYWAKNSAFDAPNFFNNKNKTRVPPYRDNRYGLSAGGPVRLPKVYDGTNKTFWYYAWEANKWGAPYTFTGTVPTEAERRGDLSALLRVGANYQIYDPFTTTPAAGGRFSRLPLAGNIIPASRLDKVGSNLAGLYPLPNQPGTVDGRNNFFHPNTAKEDYYVHLARVDHSFSEKNRAFVRIHYDHWVEDKNNYYGNRLTGIILMRINRGLALDNVHVLNPSLVLNVRYGITNQEFPERRISRGYDLSKLGFSQNLTSLVDGSLATIPRFSAGAFSTFSSWESGDGTNSGLTHSLAATLTRLYGAHNLKFGADARLYRAFGARFPYTVSPDFSFSNSYTRGPLDNSPAAPVGQELASMLLGIPAGSMAFTASSALQDTFLGLFLHDDFKVTRKLTVNAGIRYEIESPMTERYNRLVAGFAFDEPNPIEAQAKANYAARPIPEIAPSAFRVLGGQAFLNERGVGRSPFRGEKNNLMPRIGFAYQLLPTTTVRGGYGLYFDSLGVNAQVAVQSGFSQTTPIQASLDNGLTFIASNANPFPRGLISPPGQAGGLRTNLGQGISFYSYDLKHPYSQRWSIGFQRLLPGSWLLDTSYVGNRVTRLPATRSLNDTPARYLSTKPARDLETINYLSAAFPNPFQGIDPIYGATISRGSLLRPYPHFGGIGAEESIGYSWYHSLQTRIEKRFSQGYTFQFSHAWSKSMEAVEFLNPTDPALTEAISGFDRPQRVAASGIWEIPAGRGRRFGARMPRALEFIAGGWQLGGLVSIQSGPPLGFGNVIFNGDIKDIPLPAGQRSADRWFNINAGFNRDSAQQLGSNIRTFPLRFSGFRQNVLSRWDFSMIKNFAILERLTFQFRSEVFNAWNHPSFSGPNLSPTSSAFGAITSTANESRQWQFSGRIKW
ncbi:MAG: carboxypeptidase-like regulatory domain-containing protein [Acidobacteriota bacterium]